MIEEFVISAAASLVVNLIPWCSNLNTNYRLRIAEREEIPFIASKIMEYLLPEERKDFEAYLNLYYKRREIRNDIFLIFEKVELVNDNNTYSNVGCVVLYPLKKTALKKLTSPESNITSLCDSDLFISKNKKCSVYYTGFAWAEEKSYTRGKLLQYIFDYVKNNASEVIIFGRPTSEKSLKLMKKKKFNIVNDKNKKPELLKLCKIKI